MHLFSIVLFISNSWHYSSYSRQKMKLKNWDEKYFHKLTGYLACIYFPVPDREDIGALIGDWIWNDEKKYYLFLTVPYQQPLSFSRIFNILCVPLFKYLVPKKVSVSCRKMEGQGVAFEVWECAVSRDRWGGRNKVEKCLRSLPWLLKYQEHLTKSIWGIAHVFLGIDWKDTK